MVSALMFLISCSYAKARNSLEVICLCGTSAPVGSKSSIQIADNKLTKISPRRSLNRLRKKSCEVRFHDLSKHFNS